MSTLFVFIPAQVTAQTEPDVTLTLFNDIMEADIRPGEQGSVTFNGVAKCAADASDPTIKSITVTLMVVVDRGFATSINPKEFTLHPEDSPSADFSVTFTIPPETSASDIYGFKVYGTAKYLPGAKTYNIPSVNGTITVKPYLRFGVSSQAVEDAFPGEDADAGLTITNYGNYDEEFTITITNTTIPNEDDWDLTITNPTINIQQYEYITVFVHAEVPDDAKKGSYLINLEVTPGGSNGTIETKSYHATVYINVVSRIGREYDYMCFSIIGGVVLLAVIIVATIIILRRWRSGQR